MKIFVTIQNLPKQCKYSIYTYTIGVITWFATDTFILFFNKLKNNRFDSRYYYMNDLIDNVINSFIWPLGVFGQLLPYVTYEIYTSYIKYHDKIQKR